jgi:GH24 family phage-related lysozyme (muramidase)
MPRFPTYERRQPLQGGSTASYAGDAIAAPARALQGLGEGIANAGNDIAAALNKTRESQDDTWFSKARAETAVDMIGQEQEAKKAATDGATDYTPTIRSNFQQYRQQKIANAPSKRAEQMYQQWADSYDVDLTQRSARFQAESELAKRTSDFSDAMNAHAQAIYADPSQYDVVHKRAMDDFEGAKQWMTPEQEAVAREKVDHDLKLSRAKSLVEFAPADFIAEVGMSPQGGDAAAVIRKFEGFRTKPYWDVNAHRVGYGSDTITKADGSVVKVTPETTVSRADAERDLTRRVGEFENTAIRQVGQREWGALPEGARAALTSVAYNYGDLPNSVVLAVKSGNIESIATAVEGLKGHNNGVNSDRRQQEAAIIRGGSIPKSANFSDDPRYAGLSVDEVRSLSGQAEQAVNTQRNLAYNQAKDSMQLGIATGQVISEDQILGSDLGDGDKATLLGQFRSKNRDEGVISQTLAALADRSLNVSPYDTDAIKALDTIAERAEKRGSTEQFMQSSEEIVRQSGVVPKPYMNRIRQGLESANVEQVGAAAELARRVNQIDPAALARRDGGSKVADAATAYSHYVDTVGMSPEQAAQRLIDMNDPEKVKARASLMESKPTKDWITKKATESNVRDIFDPGIFGFDPTLGSNPAQSAAMVGEYRSILEESLWDANGDQELAETFAGQRFARRYGTSSFTLDGETSVTRLPPEKTYPAGADGTHGYIMDQALAALKAEGVDASVVYLQSDDMTNRDVVTGQPARYQVFYEKDGQIERFGLPFYALPEAEAGIPRSTIMQSRARRDQYRNERLNKGTLEDQMRRDATPPDDYVSPLLGTQQ